MIFDGLGYPRPAGASDFEDSSHLAGICSTIGAGVIQCAAYVNQTGRFYFRCPGSKYNFSRDQFTCLAAGLIKQGRPDLVRLEYINGRDIMPPSVRGLVTIAKRGRPYWFQKLWLKAEILFKAAFDPLGEPNQIICLCACYGPEFLKFYVKHVKTWAVAVDLYWNDWRNEPELAENIKNFVIFSTKQKRSGFLGRI